MDPLKEIIKLEEFERQERQREAVLLWDEVETPRKEGARGDHLGRLDVAIPCP
jgi:hypothetical protein